MEHLIFITTFWENKKKSFFFPENTWLIVKEVEKIPWKCTTCSKIGVMKKTHVSNVITNVWVMECLDLIKKNKKFRENTQIIVKSRKKVTRW